MGDNSHVGSCCCNHRFSPCVLWTSFCSWFVHVLERFFGWFGEGIAKHPLLTIPLCLVFVSICSVGFAWMKVENRTEKLFIPQNSKAMEDLNAAEKYFPVRFREEIVLLVASSDPPNVINRVCLEQALEVHQAVVELKSYSELCLTLSGVGAKNPKECMMINPLEIFQFDKGNLNRTNSQLQEKVSKEYTNTMNPQGMFVMRNGRSFRYNFGRMFGKVEKERENITGAQALQMIYYMRDPSDKDSNVKILEWEKTFVDKLQSLVGKRSCFAVHFSSERSLDDAIAESSGSDVTLVSITFTLMITFACVMLGKFTNPLTGHSLLANAGVFAVALGILAGFGLAMWCRVPFVSLVGVLPFLILGIGIDDMFILVDELDRQQRSMTVVETVKEVLSRSGATITMTTLTDLVAFAVSTSTSFPAIRYFCVYAALTVTFSYLMIVTYFVAIMSYDVKRIKAGRRDCLPFCRAPPPRENAPAWDEPRLQTSNKLMEAWARFLTLSVVKVFVIIFSWCFLAAGIYGVAKVDESFDRRILAKDDSYLKKFLSTQEEYFELSIPVSVVETGNIDYGKRSVQEELRSLSKIVTSNKYYENRTLSWIEEFSQYALHSHKNILGSNFTPELLSFLNIYSNFKQDVKFSLDNKSVEVSRIMGFMKTSTSSSFQKNAMLTLREDLQTGTLKNLAAFPIARPFIFFEQYAITSRETLRNLLIAALAVLIVTSPFLVDCTVTLLVVLNFAALICELFGLMVIWGVSLNSVSMINLVMAIGFAVDYSAHIAHAYVMSDKDTANERVVEALSTLGASVLMGGFSTFLGMVVLAFAASEIFRIFFKMFLGIVVFGLLHGLCILPVYLSLFDWKPAITKPISAVHVSDEYHSENDGVVDRLQHDGKGRNEKVSTDGDLRSASSNEGFELHEQRPLNESTDDYNRSKDDATDYMMNEQHGGDEGAIKATTEGDLRSASSNEGFELHEQRPLNESTDDYYRSKDDATDYMMNEQHGGNEGAIKAATEGDLRSASSNEGFELNDQSRPLDRTVVVTPAHQENNESNVHNEVHDMEKEDIEVESNDPTEVPQKSNAEESERELFLTTQASEHGQEEGGNSNSKRYAEQDTPLTLNEQNIASDDSTKF